MPAVRKSEGPRWRWSFLFAVLFAVTMPAGAATPASRLITTLAGWPIGDFALTDQHGLPFTQENLDGHWTFLIIDGSPCAGANEGALSALAGMYRRIAATRALEETQVVLVSTDHQSKAAAGVTDLAAYDPRFIGATGAAEGLAGLLDDLGVTDSERVYGETGGSCGDPESESVWLIGPDRVLRGQFSAPFDVLRLTSDFLRTRLRG